LRAVLQTELPLAWADQTAWLENFEQLN